MYYKQRVLRYFYDTNNKEEQKNYVREMKSCIGVKHTSRNLSMSGVLR